MKGKVLNSNFALDFTFIDNNIRINNLLFRDKNLSFDSKGFLNIKPYFYTDLNTKIKSINPELISNFKINNLTKFKNLIKKLNSKNEIFFESSRLNNNLISELNIQTKLAYGRLNIFKSFLISTSRFQCQSIINFLEEYLFCSLIAL